MKSITVEQSGAFVERFTLPATREGTLSGLRFAVKDIIDLAGHRTGCGNPTWLNTHPPAAVSAVSVEQLLAAGATCIGKTITDEVAFSIVGENHFYGTPLNPAAPDRVPGGSSSGSASAVACGLADFALGTDTGGSVRIPASNCGIWGWRPTHGLVSVAGVMPLAPSFDTVGILATSNDVLRRAAASLLATESSATAPTPSRIHLLAEAFEIADVEVRDALQPVIAKLRDDFGPATADTSLGDLCNDREAANLSTWIDIYRALLAIEVGSSLGSWVAEAKPNFGPAATKGFEFVSAMDRTRVNDATARRERYCRGLRAALGPHDLICMPTMPAIAPLKGTCSFDRSSDYYSRVGSLNAIAGVARLPQVSMPLANVDGVPVGLSLIGAPFEDDFLLATANAIEKRW